ncbi:membrane fusion protein, multidrug efflux system [Maridesulfovibrio ferrireducens]|uniref:Membrane fusion protein, multidrug efflux system n=1 Tax=Maridesulfovibrio ferrireducens TaxID=246191 RepID=A0A1G9EG02_9BACT|nr:efflux RND transporter periplasmic adaptor subunit [Maridesulfovibrio ferrireducens]SDK75046.1 membrane fusion protein, multidrug efflux system [Maridesulfovibrio ferrireducens]
MISNNLLKLKNIFIHFIHITLIISTGFVAQGCGNNKETVREIPPAPVTIANAEQKPTPYYLTAIGTVKAINTITVRSRITGYLSKISIANGDFVTAGQQMFTMDPTQFEASIRQYKAERASDITKYKQAKRDYDRYRDLVRRKVVSSEDFEQKRLEMKTASDSIAVTEAKLVNAKNDLNYCFIKSPINGLAGYIFPTAGNLIEENKDELVIINQIFPIAVNFYLPQKYLVEVQKYAANGTLSVLAISEGNPVPAEGSLTFIDNNVDTKTGTVWMQATFPNKKRTLWPGNYVDIRLKLFEENVVRIPMQATCDGPNGKFVWIMHQNKTVEMQHVDINRRSGKLDIVTSGLKDGQTIITDGQLRLFPGAVVKVKDGSTNSTGNTNSTGSSKGNSTDNSTGKTAGTGE